MQRLADRIIARLEKHHPASARHSERVAETVARVAEELDDPDLPSPSELYTFARMHDAGKLWIVRPILTFPGRLDEFGWAYMTEHAAWGEFVIRKEAAELGTLLDVRAIDMAVAHHERPDGTGYPRGLVGEEIPLLARLCALCDVWDALVSKRSYKLPLRPEVALEELRRGAGTQFDAALTPRVLATLERPATAMARTARVG